MPSMVVCKCGSRLFYESVRCNGWWVALISESGDVEDTNLDNLKYGPTPKTVVCAECRKRNPNPRYKETV